MAQTEPWMSSSVSGSERWVVVTLQVGSLRNRGYEHGGSYARTSETIGLGSVLSRSMVVVAVEDSDALLMCVVAFAMVRRNWDGMIDLGAGQGSHTVCDNVQRSDECP